MINANTRVCCVIGNPINHSLSPLLHNTGYRALAIDNKFVYTAFNVKASELEQAVNAFRVFGIKGISVTIPHKIEIVKFLDSIDDAAKKIGAVNTIINYDGKLTGTNTDYLGIFNPLNKVVTLENKKVAILGSGGASRAAIYAMKNANAKVTIFNRTIHKAEELANEFDVCAESLINKDKIKDFDIVINCTSLGLKVEDKPVLLARDMHSKQVVFDSIYNQYETALLKEAKAAGARTLHGVEMFLEQGMEQFKLYTGQEAPKTIIKETLFKHFGWRND